MFQIFNLNYEFIFGAGFGLAMVVLGSLGTLYFMAKFFEAVFEAVFGGDKKPKS